MEPAEIAAEDGRCGQGRVVLNALALGKPLLIDHEEKAVFGVEELGNGERTAEHESVIVISEGQLRRESDGRVVVPSCIRVVVTQEIERGSVIRIAAALGDHVDLGRVVTVLGRIDAGLHLHFLNGVDRGLDHKAVEVHVGIVDAIERVVVVHDALAAHGDRFVGALAALPRLGLALRCRERVGVRRDRHQAQVVSTVQRHLADGLRRNHGAEGGVVSLQQSGSRLDGHRLCHLTDLQREILTQ